LLNYANLSNAQLVINIKNKGGEVFQEKIIANTTEDTIQLEYRYTDDSVITQFIDFKNDIQIARIILLGEEERGDQNQYESFCFITLLNRSDLISSDAMSKLRQRNPGTIRQADKDKGKEIFEMDYAIEPKKSSVLSPHIVKLCDSSSNGLNVTQTFAREIDIRYLANSKAFTLDSLAPAAFKLSSSLATPKPVRCNQLSQEVSQNFIDQNMNESLRLPTLTTTSTSMKMNAIKCECGIYICIPWYPCGLKYCKEKDSSGKTINYKCGISTCKKCILFKFQVSKKQSCLWDE
ncbi:Out at first protein-like protein, partial [Dinothrombium tinctorium]